MQNDFDDEQLYLKLYLYTVFDLFHSIYTTGLELTGDSIPISSFYIWLLDIKREWETCREAKTRVMWERKTKVDGVCLGNN